MKLNQVLKICCMLSFLIILIACDKSMLISQYKNNNSTEVYTALQIKNYKTSEDYLSDRKNKISVDKNDSLNPLPGRWLTKL